MGESNLDVVRRGFEALRRGDLEALAALLHPEIRWHGGDPDAEGACNGSDQVLRRMARFQARRRPEHWPEIAELIDAGDRVVMIVRVPSEDGLETRLTANVTTFRDGRAVEIVHHPDPAEALRAAGVDHAGAEGG